MNTSIRKDNKVLAHTNNNVVIIGTVISVKGEKLTIKTVSGKEHTVLKVGATKLSVAEFKTQILEASQPKMSVTKKSRSFIKKSKAKAIFLNNINEKRSVVISKFMDEADLTKNGASTYYQNFKSGFWIS